MGDMADAAYDRVIDEMFDNDHDPAKECKYCGAFPLFWLNEKGKWILTDQKGKKHVCQNAKREDPFYGV